MFEKKLGEHGYFKALSADDKQTCNESVERLLSQVRMLRGEDVRGMTLSIVLHPDSPYARARGTRKDDSALSMVAIGGHREDIFLALHQLVQSVLEQMQHLKSANDEANAAEEVKEMLQRIKEAL